MLLFHSHPRPLYSSPPGLLSRPIPRNPDCTQPSVSRFVGSILQRPQPLPSPPSLPSCFFLPQVRVFPRVAPYFSCFAAASRSTFIQYRYVLGRFGEERADAPRGSNVPLSSEKVGTPLGEVAFSFDSLPSPTRSATSNVPRLAKCRLERRGLVQVHCAVRTESSPLRGERTIAAIK